MPDRSPEVRSAVAAGLAALAAAEPLVLKFRRESDNGPVTMKARFPLSALRSLQALSVQRPTIRGFVIDNVHLAIEDEGVLVTACLGQPAQPVSG